MFDDLKAGRRPALLLLIVAATPFTAHADVTITQETTTDALIMKMHSTAVERTTADKQRRESESKGDGFLGSMIGTIRSADIVRLDRDLEWHLDVDKKRYRETPFPTAEQRAQMQQKMQAALDRLKQCPATAPQQNQPDPTCEKTTPTFNVTKSGDTATIAGHPTHKLLLTMTYSCKSPKTGDVCDFTASSELWTADDDVPGYADKRAFGQLYMQKMGLDPSGATVAQMRAALAPYADQLKELSAKASDIKGTPLRTVVSISVGGAQCAAARAPAGVPSGGSTVADAGTAGKDAATNTATGEASSNAQQAIDHAAGDSVAGRVLGSAANAFSSKMIGGLFAKKPATPPANAAAAPTAPAAGSAQPGTRTLISMKTEVTGISTDAIPSSQFDLPAGYQKIEPKPGKDPDDFECPKAPGH